MTTTWAGVFPAVTTQLRDDESLDIEATLRHVDVLLGAGVHGLVMLGTVGECCSLEEGEKVELLSRTVDHVAGRVPVLSGVAEYTTAQAVRAARHAASQGVDGLMVLPAMVYRPDERETLAHFGTVAAATDLPVMIYNNPVSYGVDVAPETFARLADVETVVAIKESSEDPRRITDIRNETGDRFTLFCGVDDVVLESVAAGAEGWVSGLVNAFPDENALLWDLMAEGRWNEARDVYRWYMPLLHLDTRPKLVQFIKLAVQERGFGSEVCRAPRLPLEGQERERILDLIRRSIATRPGRRSEG